LSRSSTISLATSHAGWFSCRATCRTASSSRSSRPVWPHWPLS
jgi:hypothetical protein